MPQGIVTIDTTLSYKEGSMADYVEFEGLTEVGEIGGEPEKIDVTTLKDKVKKTINGVKDLGDLTFKFLYDNSTATSNYRVLQGLEADKKVANYKITYPDGTEHSFNAEVSVKMDSAAVNGVLTFSASMALQSEITIKHPALKSR